MSRKHKLNIMAGVLLVTMAACNKFVDTPLPASQITATALFTNDATATSVLLGAYASVVNINGSKDYSADLFADDIYMPNPSSTVQVLQENGYLDANANFLFFDNYYKAIFNANSLLEQLNGASGVTDSTKRLLQGEARFIRAFCYFQLVNLYATPPLVTTTDVNTSAYIGNSTPAQVYDLIISDLKEAYDLVGAGYPGADRVRANKAVVSAMLAKVYLYTKQWANAETEATRQIDNTTYSLPADVSALFVKSSPETIWQLWNSLSYNVQQSSSYLPANTTSLLYALRPGLVNAFEANDNRKAAWIRQGTGASAALYYPYKYHQRATTTGATVEYPVQLRLAEQYLIRAEARAQQNNITGGLDDLNVIRLRANLPAAAAADKDELLLKIEQERRIELMTEASNRWYDLNRTGRTSYWLAPQKPTWMARDTLLPYYSSILLSNPNLHQNNGY